MSLSLSLNVLILGPSLSMRQPYDMHIFYLMGLLLPTIFCKQLKTFASEPAWQTITNAFSACSDTKWLVSVAFLISGYTTESIFGSRSRVGSSENISWTAMQAFFATWDLRLSVCLTTFLMHSFYPVPLYKDSRFLWNIATLLTTFSASNTFCQSSDLRLVIAYLNWFSGLCKGSSGVV